MRLLIYSNSSKRVPETVFKSFFFFVIGYAKLGIPYEIVKFPSVGWPVQ